MADAGAWEFGDLLTDVATIYGRATSGRSTVVTKASLPCRVSTANFHDAAGADRAELAAVRTLYWVEDYELAPDAVVQINGSDRRWNVRPETIRRIAQPDGSLAHWECDLLGSNRPPAPVTR